jgi:hypothetical protein
MNIFWLRDSMPLCRLVHVRARELEKLCGWLHRSRRWHAERMRELSSVERSFSNIALLAWVASLRVTLQATGRCPHVHMGVNFVVLISRC